MKGRSLNSFIKHSASNLLATNLFVLIPCLLLVVVFHAFFFNFTQPRAILSQEELVKLNSVMNMSNPNVSVRLSQLHDTHVDAVGSNQGPFGNREQSSVKGRYYLAKVGDKRLIVKALPGTTNKNTFEGQLVFYPVGDTARILSDGKSDLCANDSDVLRFMLDTTITGSGGAFKPEAASLLFMGLPILVICLYNLFRSLSWYGSPASHPVMAALAQYGPASQVAREIDAELRSGVVQIGPVTFTPHWMIWQRIYKVEVMRLDDMLWAYKSTMRFRQYVGSRTIHLAHLQGRTNRMMVEASDVKTNQIVDYLVKLRPWIFVGENSQLAVDYVNNRQAVIAAVDARRVQMQPIVPPPSVAVVQQPFPQSGARVI